MLHRASDVSAARAFYTAVLDDTDIEISQLPEAALARGARAHWLGAIGVDDVAEAVAMWVARGAAQLGAIQRDARGAFATVRDPGGAVIALTTPSSAAHGPTAVWSHLDARNAETTFEVYAALFGWRTTESVELGRARRMRYFAWNDGGPSVGSYAELADRPGIHPGWLFHFAVHDLDSAVDAVRSLGGVVLADADTPSGARVVVCDDAQGSGFALRSAG